MVIGGDAHRDIGRGAVALGVAVQDGIAQIVHRRGQIDLIAGILHRVHRVVQRGKHRQIGRRAGGAGIGREVENHHRHFALVVRGAAQRHQLGDAGGQRAGALLVRHHLVPRFRTRRGAAAEGHRPDRAVKLGNRHHHGGFHRQQATRIVLPLLQRLELDRVGGDIGHVQHGEQRLGGVRVVVGGAADQREAGERDHRIHRRHAVAHEEALDRRARIKPAGEGRDHPQSLRLQRGDDAIIMVGIAGQHVGAQQQHAHRAALAVAGHQRRILDDATGHARMVDADIGVFDRCGCLQLAAQGLARAGGVAVHQQADHVGDVLFRARQPVLQRQEIGAHILRRAGDEAQQLRQLPQQPHLPLPARALGGLAAQPLEEAERAAGLGGHAEPAEPGQLHHLTGRQAGQHGVAMLAPGRQRRQHGADMVVEEQHAGDHDIAACDIGAAGFQRGLVAGPFVGSVHDQFQPRKVAPQRRARPPGGAGQMTVHRHDDDADGRRFSGRSALWLHTTSQR